VGFEAITAVTMKIVFRDIIAYSVMDVSDVSDSISNLKKEVVLLSHNTLIYIYICFLYILII
jgi:hypothetical protein